MPIHELVDFFCGKKCRELDQQPMDPGGFVGALDLDQCMGDKFHLQDLDIGHPYCIFCCV